MKMLDAVFCIESKSIAVTLTEVTVFVYS